VKIVSTWEQKTGPLAFQFIVPTYVSFTIFVKKPNNSSMRINSQACRYRNRY